MKRLSMGDWSVIARYLSKEASAEDEDRFALLVDRYPKLRDDLLELDRALGPLSAVVSSVDEMGAFERLTERFKKENLI